MKTTLGLLITAPISTRLRLRGTCGHSLILILALLGLALTGVARGQVVTEFPISTTDPFGVTKGPDGNLWFTEFTANQIGRITPPGVVTQFTIPTADNGPDQIAAGPDGNLWFTENTGNKIGRITTAGVVTEFPIPTAGSRPFGIVAGSDGNLWFTEGVGANKIGRITPAGVVTEFAIPPDINGPGGIAAGPDGNLWFTYAVHVVNFTTQVFVGRMTTAGVVTGTFSVGTGQFLFARSIAAGPDGNLWFTKSTGSQIGRITTAGVITEFPAASSNSAHLCAGPDGNLWFTEASGNGIGRITTAGVVSAFPIPAVGGLLAGIASGPDGNLWFTESTRNRIGQITTGGVVAEFPLPIASTQPVSIAAGADGNLWFTQSGADGDNQIGRISTAGPITEFTIPTLASGPVSIVAASDGSLWFAESGVDRIARITTSGVFPGDFDLGNNTVPVGIAAGPDGALWFVERVGAKVVRITTAGAMTEFPVPLGDSFPAAITAGPDGNLWFTEYGTGSIGRMTTAGVITEFPTPMNIFTSPVSIAAGPDGNLWFTENHSLSNRIGRITPTGVLTEFPIPTADSGPYGIAAGADGNLWFTEGNANQIGRITTDGVITEFPIPTANSVPAGIAAGPDGNLWFTEVNGNNIGRITTGPTTPQLMTVDAGVVAGGSSNANGVLEPGETVQVDPSWENTLTDPQSFKGTASNLAGPAGLYAINDSSADYGTLSPGSSGDCDQTTGDCYLMTVSGARPAIHWDATFTESLSSNSISKVRTLHVGGSFTDVNTDIAVDPYYPSIEAIFHNQVSAGCQDGTKFCPTSPTTRQEMAVFLLKASQGSGFHVPPCAGIFSDVPCTPGVGFSDWIENLSNRGITAGCQPGDPPAYCPTREVLRSEMAVFLLKTSHGSSYDPPDCAGIFSDVPCTPGVGFSDWIEDLYNRGVTSGCQAPGDPLMYCPDRSVLRQEMSVFLVKMFGLQLYGP